MHTIDTIRGFKVRFSNQRDDDVMRYNADIWTADGWVSGSCMALDGETLDKELDQKLTELIANNVKPGV
jgi:hypothetical protein